MWPLAVTPVLELRARPRGRRSTPLVSSGDERELRQGTAPRGGSREEGLADDRLVRHDEDGTRPRRVEIATRARRESAGALPRRSMSFPRSSPNSDGMGR